ncbi:MAG: hypothetical protein ABIK28_09045, partial [Planctomycetota bacterium]
MRRDQNKVVIEKIFSLWILKKNRRAVFTPETGEIKNMFEVRSSPLGPRRIAAIFCGFAIPFLLALGFFSPDEDKPIPDENKPRYEVKAFEAEVGKRPDTFMENTYLVYHVSTKDAVILDPGAEVEEMESFIKSAGLKV